MCCRKSASGVVPPEKTILSSEPNPPGEPDQPVMIRMPLAAPETPAKVRVADAPPGERFRVELAVSINAPMVLSVVLLAFKVPPAKFNPAPPRALPTPNVIVP